MWPKRHKKPGAVAVLADDSLSRDVYKTIGEVPQNTEPTSIKAALKWVSKADIEENFDIIIVSFSDQRVWLQSTEVISVLTSRDLQVLVCSQAEDYLKEMESTTGVRTCQPNKLKAVVNKMLYSVSQEVVNERIAYHTSQKQAQKEPA